ncbi:unnamed protein product [Durusdinium trenchii]|uniref:Uncharacterized protein n=1 Tax=Durusdinium trenchii TaxID=1381693 RepID=A0ABP0JYU1_9DINO
MLTPICSKLFNQITPKFPILSSICPCRSFSFCPFCSNQSSIHFETSRRRLTAPLQEGPGGVLRRTLVERPKVTRWTCSPGNRHWRKDPTLRHVDSLQVDSLLSGTVMQGASFVQSIDDSLF